MHEITWIFVGMSIFWLMSIFYRKTHNKEWKAFLKATKK